MKAKEFFSCKKKDNVDIYNFNSKYFGANKKKMIFCLFFFLYIILLLITGSTLEPDTVYSTNFASFTYQSNFLLSIWYLMVFVVIFFIFYFKKKNNQINFDRFVKLFKILNISEIRVSLSLWILLTGIVGTFLLYIPAVESNSVPNFTAHFYALALHVSTPLIALLDFFFFSYFYKKTKISLTYFISLGYPLIYLAFSLGIGSITNVYPYNFFDPSKTTFSISGYGHVIIYVGMLITAFSILEIFFIYFVNRKYYKVYSILSKEKK